MSPDRITALISRVAVGGLAASLCVLGLMLILRRGFYDCALSYRFDFGECHAWVGALFMGAGVWLAYVALAGARRQQR